MALLALLQRINCAADESLVLKASASILKQRHMPWHHREFYPAHLPPRLRQCSALMSKKKGKKPVLSKTARNQPFNWWFQHGSLSSDWSCFKKIECGEGLRDSVGSAAALENINMSFSRCFHHKNTGFKNWGVPKQVQVIRAWLSTETHGQNGISLFEKHPWMAHMAVSENAFSMGLCRGGWPPLYMVYSDGCLWFMVPCHGKPSILIHLEMGIQTITSMIPNHKIYNSKA